jgi:hypothetical protein
MMRPQVIGLWPGERRNVRTMTCDEVRSMPEHPPAGMNGKSEPHLWLDRYPGWPGRVILFYVNPIIGAWKWGSSAAGDRVPCRDSDPDREPGSEGSRSTGYSLVWVECPLLERLLKLREAQGVGGQRTWSKSLPS